MFEIGNSLREARIRQGLGYPEIELATKIRSKYIRALEEEDFAILPGDTYVRGFLRAYADHLGLDGQLYVDEYASRFGVDWRDELPPAHVRRSVGKRQRTVERRAVVLALAGIAAVTVLVFVAWRYGGVNASNPAAVKTPKTPAVAPPKLVLRGVGKGTYVEVRRNSTAGTLLLQGTVSRGTEERLTGRKFYLFVRRSAGVRVLLGGKSVALPARKNLRVLVTPQRTVRLRG